MKIETIEREGFGYEPFDYDIDEVEELEENIKKNKLIVKEILESYDKATNNDLILYFEFLRVKFQDIQVTSSKENIIFKFPRKQIKYFNSPETITRCRRLLNQDGIGLPTNKAVLIRRSKRQKILKEILKKQEIATLNEVLTYKLQ